MSSGQWPTIEDIFEPELPELKEMDVYELSELKP
jgi:hypothetical protein